MKKAVVKADKADTGGECQRMEFDEGKARHIMMLKQLAKDICEHLVFTSYHIPEKKMNEMLCVVFPILFANKVIKDKIETEAGLVYEYMDKARPESDWAEGYPTFESFSWLNKEDTELVRGFVNELVKGKSR